MDKIQPIDTIDVTMDKAFPSAGDGSLSHALLGGREFSDQHPVSAIIGLRDELDDLKITEQVYSHDNGLGEYRRWRDGNPNGEDRSGYFVSIVPGTDEIEICDSTHDVYGISVSHSGFIGNQNALYQKGNSLNNNRSNDLSYAIVGIVGAMRVRTDGVARNGDYVVPNAYGEATLSENKYGYKVLSQGSYPSYSFVTIAITPQSDALSRLESSVAGGDLGNLLIKIEAVEKDIDGLEVKVDASAEDVQDILDELGDVRNAATTAEQVAQSAKSSAEDAQAVAAQAKDEAVQAAQSARDDADKAVQSAADALAQTKDLSENLSPILSWETTEGESNGVQGFVTQVDEDHTLLASMITGVFPNGESLSAIIQKVDTHGAVIQHLTSHIDKYTVGHYSLTHGLTYNEAKSILTTEHIYVPTTAYEETLDIFDDEGNKIGTQTFTFEKPDGNLHSYKWLPNSAIWEQQSRLVYTSTVYLDGADTDLGIIEDDLWYCMQDVVDVPEGVDPLAAGNLYIWTGAMWSWVASVDDNYQGRIITNMRQTEASIMSDVVALDGRTTSAEQNINKITTRVSDAEGNISTINQEINTINSTIATANGNISALQQRADATDASITAITLGTFPQVYQEFAGAAPEAIGNKYTLSPVWDDKAGVFVFDESSISEDGVYYFHSEDQTKYCHVTDNGYNIYTVGKEAMAMINQRIDETESRIDLLVDFDDQTTESLANITEKVDANEANIAALASRTSNTLLSVNTEEVQMYGEYKYTKEPEWNSVAGKYEFDPVYRSDDGTYYMADETNQSYCKVIAVDEETTIYEVYGVVNISLAAVEQKVDDNSASIGLVVDRVENVIDEEGNLTDESISGKGSIIIQAINGESIATINADRIELTGTDKISLIVSNAITTAEDNAKDYTDSELENYSTTTEMDSAITQKTDSITSSVAATYATKDSLGNYATTTKVSEVEQKVNENSSSIGLVVKDGAVSGSVVIEAINNDQSSAKISADHVEIDANDIDLSAHEMFSAVVSDGKITPASIVSAINNDTSSVTISADKINLTGDVIISKINGGTTTISGSKITTGSITASQIAANTITTDKLNFNINDMIDASISAFEEGMKLEVSNGTDSSTIKLKSGTTEISSQTIQFTGDVIFKSNLTDGSTTISGSNIKTGTIAANYLSLYGLTVKNTSNVTTFAVDANGAVTINGNVTMGYGSSIDWNTVTNVNGDPLTMANSAYSTAQNASSLANSAVNTSMAVANGTFSGGTFIDGTSIYSPIIYTNDFGLYDKNETNASTGTFSLYGYRDGEFGQMLRIAYFYAVSWSPYISFSSPYGAEAHWDFNYTTFKGHLDFTNVTEITGLTTSTATAVFG